MKKVVKENLKLLGILCAFLVSAHHANAFVPNAGQIVRFQPGLARNQKPFTSSGTMVVGDKRFTIDLFWYGPLKYSVQISGLTKNLYLGDSTSEKWILTRDQKSCTIKTDIQLVGCPEASVWAQLELSGSPDAALKALKKIQILNDDDIPFQETDAKKEALNTDAKKRVQLNLGQNGAFPIAVAEISGPNAEKDSQGIIVPTIQFDQNFLAPLLLRYNDGTDLITWKAASDLEVTKENPRFNYVLSSRLELNIGATVFASISRKDRQIAGKMPPFNAQRAIGDINALKNSLSDDGLSVLKALLLTH